MVKPSLYFKERIVTLRLQNLSYSKILLQIGNEGLKITKASIISIWKKYENNLSLKDNSKTGRRCILTKEMNDYIDMLIRSNREIKVSIIRKAIRCHFKVKVCNRTISRAARRLKWIRKTTKYIYTIYILLVI